MSEKEKAARFFRFLSGQHEFLMEEGQEDAGLGAVRIHNNVIADITRAAAAAVPGVVDLSGTLVDDLVDRFGRRARDRGVRVALEPENRITVELNVILEYGVYIPEVCGRLQQEVRRAIETLTGRHVQAVNVSVQSLRRPPQAEQEENI